MSRFIAIANQKGGVGKTTTTVNLAASLASLGQRVLVLDMDPQGNASSGLGVAANALHRGIYEVLMGSMSVQEAIWAQASPGVDLLPSGQRLIGAEVELVSALARERILEKNIRAVRDNYDILLADCPPSLGLLTVNTLTAADTVLIPMQCEYYALEGLTQLLNTIKLIQHALNPRLEIEGILLTMFDARLNLSREVAAEARKFFPGRVYGTVIPRNVRLSEAPSFGKPVLQYDPECAGAQFYLKLARELLNLPEDAVAEGAVDSKQGAELEPASPLEHPAPEHMTDGPGQVSAVHAPSSAADEVVQAVAPAAEYEQNEAAGPIASYEQNEPTVAAASEDEWVVSSATENHYEPTPIGTDPTAEIVTAPISEHGDSGTEEPVADADNFPGTVITAGDNGYPGQATEVSITSGDNGHPEQAMEAAYPDQESLTEKDIRLSEEVANLPEPVVTLSAEDLAEDVVTLPEDSIVLTHDDTQGDTHDNATPPNTALTAYDEAISNFEAARLEDPATYPATQDVPRLDRELEPPTASTPTETHEQTSEEEPFPPSTVHEPVATYEPDGAITQEAHPQEELVSHD